MAGETPDAWRLREWEGPSPGQSRFWDVALWTPESLSLQSDPSETGQHAFTQSPTFKFRQRGRDMELEFPGRCCAVDTFTKAHERHAEVLEVLEERDEMPEVAADPIQTPTDQNVERPPLGIPRASEVTNIPPARRAPQLAIARARRSVSVCGAECLPTVRLELRQELRDLQNSHSPEAAHSQQVCVA